MPKTDTEAKKGTNGRRENQKMKPFLVYQYLQRCSDENNTINAEGLVEYLQDDCGISAERRSIYKDIEEINKVLLMMEEETTIDEAAAMLEEDESLKTIVFDTKSRGYYVRQRRYDVDDIHLLAECVYSAKFLSESQAKHLAEVVCGFVSEAQAEEIKHDALLTDRVKTNNNRVITNVSRINEAMRKDDTHKPHKIRFKYLQSIIGEGVEQVERHGGNWYVVSPYKLLISDGNYYLLAFNDTDQMMKTYRVDRMKDVRAVNEPREGAEEFYAIDLRSYTKRVFGMFGGEKERVRIQMTHKLLDTALERFGSGPEATYSKIDDTSFSVAADVEISDQFFGWLLGFGKNVKLLEPQNVVDTFKAYVEKSGKYINAKKV